MGFVAGLSQFHNWKSGACHEIELELLMIQSGYYRFTND